MERRAPLRLLRANQTGISTKGALSRQESLTRLALSALSGATPSGLGTEACDLVARELGAVVTIEARAGRAANTPEHPLLSWFAVPVGGHYGDDTIMVGSVVHRCFSRQEIAFVESVAEILRRASSAHHNAEWLRHQASHDPLTGLSNRAALNAKLQAVTAEQVPVGVLVCDLDGLKLVNDQLGHRRGDELLVATASRIRDAARTGDLVARTGGDEFVVVCCAVSPEEAQQIAQRIQNATAVPLQMGGYEVTTSVSVGIALSETPGDTAELIDQADAAMYRSKARHGGSRRRMQAHPAGGVLEAVPGYDVVVEMFGTNPGGGPKVRLLSP